MFEHSSHNDAIRYDDLKRKVFLEGYHSLTSEEESFLNWCDYKTSLWYANGHFLPYEEFLYGPNLAE